VLRLGRTTYGEDALLVMAVVNRTPDSFYDRGATYGTAAAHDRVDEVIAAGADVVDIGGVKAGPGAEVDTAEELARTVDFVEQVRRRHPSVVLSVDTWRHEVADALCRAGAVVINDPWGGWDPRVAEVAAEHGAGLVCTHVGGLAPRTRPHRAAYDDVMADVIDHVLRLADRAVRLGVPREGILLDPAHDFGKNTWHSLEVTRRLDELVACGWPVLVSLSNKDFVGETLDVPVAQRLTGTLAATAVAAWLGVRIFRVHEAGATRQVLDMVAAIAGRRPPARAVRGLA
jgi:dihydropteroate synthase